jgi:hypothetical protein
LATIARQSLMDKSSLEGLLRYYQNLISGPTVGWGKNWAQELSGLERDAHAVNGENETLAVRFALLRAYALLKKGEISRPENRHVTSTLETFVKNSTSDEVMAARWLLGRIYLSTTSDDGTSDVDRYDLTSAALHHFAKISYVQLKNPVLLPGITQEYQQDHYDAQPSRDVDPVTTQIFLPFRYRSAATVSLAVLSGKYAPTHLERAMHEGAEIHSVHPGADAPRLNTKLTTNTAGMLLSLIRNENVNPIASDTEAIMRSVDDLRSLNKLSGHKAHEWMALCCANLAILTAKGETHENALSRLERELAKMMKASGRVDLPDFLFIDPSYRIALEGRYGPGSLRRRLELLRPMMDGPFLRY